MKAGADFEQARDAAPDRDAAEVGSVMRRQNLQQRRLPAPLRPMMPTYFAPLDIEAHILERPELLYLVAVDKLPAVRQIGGLMHEVLHAARDDVAQRRIALALGGTVVEEIALGQIFVSPKVR